MATKIQIEIDEKALKEMVLESLRDRLGSAGGHLTETDVKIETKSKQNYRSEWEHAAFRARVEKQIP